MSAEEHFPINTRPHSPFRWRTGPVISFTLTENTPHIYFSPHAPLKIPPFEGIWD